MAVYSDIDMKLRKATDGDITKDEEFDAIENSLQNILATLKGERRMNQSLLQISGKCYLNLLMTQQPAESVQIFYRLSRFGITELQWTT